MSTPDPVNDAGKRRAFVLSLLACVVAAAALFGVTVSSADWPGGDPEPTASVTPTDTPSTPGETPTPSGTPSDTPSTTPSTTPVAQPVRPSWQNSGNPMLTFADEFDGFTVDTAKWERGWFGEGITNGVNSNNLNCYDTAQVSQHDGALHLTVAQRAATCNGGTRQYVSGLVNSRPRTGGKGFQQQFGMFEARVCLPDANNDGAVDGFPAWWTNGPSSVPWPEHGEVDVVEGIGGRTKASLHYVSPTGTTYGSGVYSAQPLIGCHNFGYVWSDGNTPADYTDDTVAFYYDGAQLWSHAFRGPHPEYLILNYALRSTEQTVVGSEVSVDWVRVWK